MTISVVISAFNEQDTIGDCLKSVNWADELIVVDNQSSDKTAEISLKHKAKIFTQPNNPLCLNKNKNFGFSKAKGDWILSLDSDERVTEELKKEIIEKIKENTQVNGFSMPRKNIIFGKWIKHGLWYPDYQLRLFRKGKGQFPEKHNHESLEIEGEIQILENTLIHYNYSTVNQYLNKIAYFYSDNEVENFIKSGKTIHWYDAIRMPSSDFLANFFARGGYKDGLHGLVLSIMQAFYMFVVFVKIWEKQGFWEYQSEDFLKETLNEIKNKGGELIYWFNKVKDNKTPRLKKIGYKLLQKLMS